VPSGSNLDVYAQERGSNFYLPESIIHMLPTSVTKAIALSGESNALSIISATKSLLGLLACGVTDALPSIKRTSTFGKCRLIEPLLSLNASLSFCFEFDGENINNIEVMQSRVNVTNTTYDEVDKWLVAGSNETMNNSVNGAKNKKIGKNKGSLKSNVVSPVVLNSDSDSTIENSASRIASCFSDVCRIYKMNIPNVFY
jgi:exoribonuclease-2